MNSTARQARVAGGLYLLACVTAPFSLVYVPRALIVPGDARATANHVREAEGLLRLGMASELFVSIMLVFAVLALYRLFKTVDESHALAMAALLLVSVPISVINILNELAALVFARGADFLSLFERAQLDALTLFFLRWHNQGFIVAQIFWGLWLFPWGILVIRSGVVPRVLGVLLILAGCAYLFSSLTSLLLPQYVSLASRFAMVLEAGELPMVLWLLVGGVKVQPTNVPAS